MILRPFRIGEYWFDGTGALLLVALGLLPAGAELVAVLKGTDLYMFLAGMMLLAGLAMREGLFDYLAARAAAASIGSSERFFLILYLTGTLVTVLLSNNATAFVLTPAVCVTARHAEVDPPPHLFACVFIANAASFVLPIPNPANLVVFGAVMPPFATWLAGLLLPAAATIAVTCLILRRLFAADLACTRPHLPEVPKLSFTGSLAAGGALRHHPDRRLFPRREPPLADAGLWPRRPRGRHTGRPHLAPAPSAASLLGVSFHSSQASSFWSTQCFAPASWPH